VIVLVWHGAHVTLVNAVFLLVERHLCFCVFVVGVHTVVGRLYISMIGHTFVSTLLQMCGYYIYIYIYIYRKRNWTVSGLIVCSRLIIMLHTTFAAPCLTLNSPMEARLLNVLAKRLQPSYRSRNVWFALAPFARSLARMWILVSMVNGSIFVV
jgi:hypothetical protein